MIKILNYTIIALAFSVLFSACKKETIGEAIDFSFLNVANKTTYTDNNLIMTFNGHTLQQSTSNLKDIKVPAGKGLLSITDSTGKSVMDTSFTFEAGKKIDWVLFQPSNDVKPVMLDNTTSTEPQPAAGFIKIKFANFFPEAFPKPFDIIAYNDDPDTWEPIEIGRIDNITSSFPATFTEIKFLDNNLSVNVMLVDHETQEPLLEMYRTISFSTDKRNLTCYIAKGDIAVLGTPYKAEAFLLFEN